ncbi:MAG: hypothetical protein ABIW33_09530 [Sphingomicrobium sp.]
MHRIAHFGSAVLLILGLEQAATAAPAPDHIPYRWNNVVVGGGGFAPNLVFSTVEKGLAYLRTDMGGAYRWDLPARRWVPLQDMLSDGSAMGVESIAADPRDPDVVYLAAGMYARDSAAILRSSDRGRSWAVTLVPFKMGGNEDGRGLGERLAIDPNRTSTLLFGSRHDGLQRSDDSGRTWHKVARFPWSGLGPPEPRKTHAGVSFVLFDAASGRPGAGSNSIFVAVADAGSNHLYRSGDGGRSWLAVADGPPSNLLPVKGALAPDGMLYLDYAIGIGPNDIAGGAVWKLDTRSGHWTDITPARGADAEGGYMGLSLDPTHPGRLAVSTVDRWRHGDTVWLSDDRGGHWISLRERSRRDVSASPFLRFGRGEAEFGHWISGLAFDPFDGATLAYTTGATLYRTADALKSSLTWRPWVAGVEQTAIIALSSPTGGAPLISGFGDIGGFVHRQLDRSPTIQLTDPPLTNTDTIDFAGRSPNLLVRSGWLRAERQDVSLAWSSDGGERWIGLKAPPISVNRKRPERIDTNGDAPIAVSADGSTFVVSGPAALVTSDRGGHWWMPPGLPRDALVVADKIDPQSFTAVDLAGNALFESHDGARSFARLAAAGLPAEVSARQWRNRETPSPLLASPGTAGERWLLASGRLYRSDDFGRSFTQASPESMEIARFGLGKAAPGARSPALFAFGKTHGLSAIWRSTDGGKIWQRVNDDAHQWGLRIRVVTGDPRIFGRVYLGTDGRGIIYGDPASVPPLR